MNVSAEYFESLELHPGEPVSDETAPGTSEPQAAASNVEQDEIAAELGAILHGDSLDHVVAEVGAACVTRSDVASAVHAAVTDAVQAAVNGVVAVAVAAAVKANSSMNADEVEKRFRQKYLGIGTPEIPIAETAFLKPPRLQVEQDGSVALSADSGPAMVELTDEDFDPKIAAAVEGESADIELLESRLARAVGAEPVSETETRDADDVKEDAPDPALPQQAEMAVELEPVELEPVELEPVEPEQSEIGQIESAQAEPAQPELGEEPVSELLSVSEPDPVSEPEPVAEPAPVFEPEPVAEPAPVVPVVTPAVPEPVQPVVAEPAPVAAATPAVPPTEVEEPKIVSPETAQPELAEMPEPTRPSMPALSQEPESIERTLRDEKSIQFVGFQVGTQMYAVPSILIREVIRRQPVSRLPVQSRYAPGVINLRGLVIPLVSLRVLLQADMPQEGAHNQFCIITGTEGMRIALEVDKIRSMYVVQQEDIVWNVGSVLGLDDDTVIGLFELEERLVPILSVERVAAILLEEGIDPESLTA